VEGGLFLNVVVRKCARVLQLLPSKDESLLFRRNALFVLDLSLHVRDGVVWLDIKSDRFTGQCLDEDLHGTTSESQDKVEGGLFLNVVVRKCARVFQLLPSEDESLLFRRNALFVLDLGLHVRDGIIWLDVKGDRFTGQRLDEDLHGTTSQSQNKMQCALLLDVVVRKSSCVFQLLSSEDESLLFRRNAFFVLDLSFDIRDGIIWFNIKRDRFTGQCLDEDLHGAAPQSQDQVQSALFLDVVVGQRPGIFQLLSSKDEPLLFRRNPLLVLDLCLDIGDGIIGFDVQCNSFPCKGFDKYLHSHLESCSFRS